LLVFAAACKGLGDEDLAVRLYGSYIRRQAQSRLSGSTFERSSVGGARQADGPDDEAASSCAGDRRAQLVARAVAFVDGQGDGPRQVDLVCEELGVSRRTLEMAFRAVTGESPKRYFDSVRAREALGYLREFTGAASRRAGFASRIAQRAGFSSYRAFYRIFVQLYGVSPVAAMAHPDLLGRLAANAPLGSRLDSRPESRLEARAEYIELGDALISGGGVV
jgi:AraC-like DNA-binding protein